MGARGELTTMRLGAKVMIVVTAAAVAICLLSMIKVTRAEQVPPQAAEDVSSGATTPQQFKLPRLFDFEFYKERYGKRYKSMAEELTRKTYVVSNALRAFVSGMNFKWFLSDYYVGLNHMSDSSPQEREARRNKVMARMSRENNSTGTTTSSSTSTSTSTGQVGDQQQVTASGGNELPEFMPAEGENYEEEIRNLIEAHPNEPGYKELLQEARGGGGGGGGNKSRKKRDASLVELRVAPQQQQQQQQTTGPVKPRDFSFDELIAPGIKEMPDGEPAEVLAKIDNDVEGNNPAYRPPEIQTQGLNDDHVEVDRWQLPERRDERPLDKQLDNSLAAVTSRFITNYMYQQQQGQAKESSSLLPPNNDNDTLTVDGTKIKIMGEEDPDNVMFVDHRNGGCMFRPRDQGKCGSCYAFASVALAEWLYCKKRGKLVAFSEQYMVDCGNGRYGQNIMGCDGASDYSTIKFLQNFGVERQKTYPYCDRENRCPYDESTDLMAMGYIRMDLQDYAIVPTSQWETHLPYGPLYVSIAAPEDFDHFKGGVHDGHNCAESGDHAMLLVGHGREDGKDFWLIRNSYGPRWGDGGYFKLNKNAPARCIDKQIGYALGTRDAKNYRFRWKKNLQNRKVRRQMERRRRV